ncbi:putative sterigmatocystin biosynthesis P450 monooxygenase STCB [Colletotrichum fructicola]|nr:putative sterigmatocystin biosynthesis P450 monooxygenase STCB [Colletotrichum fructicola]KAF4929199.1 putative sterigmatocystin biosynthesis P450 monooxygenase STCB [Colletotrichum fructicola]
MGYSVTIGDSLSISFGSFLFLVAVAAYMVFNVDYLDGSTIAPQPYPGPMSHSVLSMETEGKSADRNSNDLYLQSSPKIRKAEAKERRKLLQHSFTLTSLRQNWESEIRQNVELAVSKIKDEAMRGTANTHKWWTLMAADIISLLSFGQSFGMLGLGKTKSTLYMQAIENALLGAVFKSDPEIFHEPHQYNYPVI